MVHTGTSDSEVPNSAPRTESGPCFNAVEGRENEDARFFIPCKIDRAICEAELLAAAPPLGAAGTGGLTLNLMSLWPLGRLARLRGQRPG